MTDKAEHKIKSVVLGNGFRLEKKDNGHWPEMQVACPEVSYACDVCPIRKFCGDNNEFDCRVYGMFSGFYLEEEFMEQFENQYDTDEAIIRASAKPSE